MNATTWSLLAAAILFGGMIAAGEIGRLLSLRRAAAADPDAAADNVGILDGAVFGLLGLVVAFSFGGAVARFDAQRALIIDEVNAVGSTYQIVDVLPEQARPALRDGIRRYLDSRIVLYRLLPDRRAAAIELGRTRALQDEIWRAAVAATREDKPAAMLVLPALNAMFDVAATRTLSMLMHPPPVIFVLMFALALASALLAGYGMAKQRRDWLRLCGFAVVASVAFYVILDIEFPRSGLIRIGTFDLALVELRANMQ